jgi:hypothetical protein
MAHKSISRTVVIHPQRVEQTAQKADAVVLELDK